MVAILRMIFFLSRTKQGPKIELVLTIAISDSLVLVLRPRRTSNKQL